MTTQTIDFTKDSEYIRLFDDDSEEFIEEVLTTELGSSLEKIEDGVGIGFYEERQ